MSRVACWAKMHKVAASALQGVHVTALREIKLLKELRHPNIINLVEVFAQKRNILLVRHTQSTHTWPLCYDD